MSRSFRVFLSFALVFASVGAVAEPRAFITREDIWSPVYLHVDGKIAESHFFSGYSKLDQLMASDPEAAAYAARASRQAIWASSFLWGGLGGALVYALASTPDHFNDGAYWLVFLAGFLPGIFMADASNTNLLKAINKYNGVPVPKFSLVPKGFGLIPVRDGAVGSLNWSF